MPYTAAICALNAKYIHSSLAPWCLAAGVRQYAENVTAHVVEGSINEDENDVLTRILSFAPDAVTFTCYLWNIAETLRLAAAVKAAKPAAFVVLGGPEVSYCAAETLAQNPQIDCILSGEGETSLPALLHALAEGENLQTIDEKMQIDGLCTRAKITAPCVLHGAVPTPYTAEYLARLGGRIAYLETSRGCPYTCAFCLSGRCGKPRYFPLDTAFENILTLANSGTQTVKFIDRTFNANPRHANAILAFILAHIGKEIPRGVCFHFELAGDILREETMKLFEKAPAGAFQLEIGMQSFCAKTLAAIRRKTDVAVLQKNILRLVAMQNMHIHIDLIAGLPYEDLQTFGESFNIGYALGANMLQLGFLKLLHGAAMREEPQVYPCTFAQTPPYEVTQTPWLSAADLAVLRAAEDALERVYNSGRFLETAAYLIDATQKTPFDFYCMLGEKGKSLGTHHVPLDDYTAFLYETGKQMSGVCVDALRDAMVRDRLATNATGRLPACLQVKDLQLLAAVRALAQEAHTAPKKGIQRGVSLLYGAKKVCYADYSNAEKNPMTGRYPLHYAEMPSRKP
ncbi:MAG: DUF4080 domain-containing protein, partial [Ruthenibacterium sp.]